MIEKIVLDYLNEKLEPVPAYMEFPETKTVPCVVVEKTGSGEADRIKSATIAIQSMADSLFNTAVLNERVKEAMSEITELDDICRAELNSDYNFTNTQTKQYRYQAVYELVHY